MTVRFVHSPYFLRRRMVGRKKKGKKERKGKEGRKEG